MSEPEAPGSLTRTVVRGVSLAGTGWGLGQALNFGFYIALARLATPSDFGKYAAAAILVNLGSMFAESGMLAALIQRRDRVEEAANTVLISTVVAGIGLSLLALALSPLVGLVFNSHDITLVAAAMSGFVLLNSAAIVPGALLQRRFSFLRRVVVEPLGIVAFGVVAIVLTSKGMGIWGLVIGNYAQSAVVLASSWVFAGWRPKPRLASFQMWRELAGYGRHVLASELVRRISSFLHTAIVGRLVGIGALGQFSYAARIAQKPHGAVMNVGSYVLLPALSRISADEARFRRAFLRALRWISITAVPVGLIIFPLGEPLALILFGDQWRDAGHAAMAMCAYVGARSYVSISSDVFKAAPRPDRLPVMHLISAILTVGFTVAFVPLGVVGVAAAVSISSIGVAAYAIRTVGQILDIPVRRMIREIWPPVLAAAAMAALLYPLERFVLDADSHSVVVGVALLGGEGAAGALVYLGMLALIAPTMARDVVGLLGVARRRLARRSSAAAETDAAAHSAAP